MRNFLVVSCTFASVTFNMQSCNNLTGTFLIMLSLCLNYGLSIVRNKRSIATEGGREDNSAYLAAKQFAYAPGDFILGGLFAVHIPDSNSQLCAKVLQRSGMWVESVLYAIDVINNSSDTLAGIQLGFEIRDDCSDPNKALEVSINFKE